MTKIEPSKLVHITGFTKTAHKKTEPHLRIVTFNVHFGKDPIAIAGAINKNKNLHSADIILLQEIENHEAEKEPRVKILAEELEMHYVYAPARMLRNEKGTHGLAVLSRFPISDVEIIPLNFYRLLWSSRQRIAMRVNIDIEGSILKVFNIHLDTLLNANERLDQMKPVIDRIIADNGGPTVIGGDFNTLPVHFFKRALPAFLRDQRKTVDEFFLKQGFKAQVEELGSTLSRGYIKFKLDAIYIRGAEALRYGIEQEVRISDHKPLWADISL
jgi:endonuclease/exonuclease/phosphatase family metal-dependent hydrolase